MRLQPKLDSLSSSRAWRDECWMRLALSCAEQAFEQEEVPVGAVLIYQDTLLAASWNQSIRLHDPSSHAEILAIRAACQRQKNYRLPETTLYVTLEPCLMCVGALIQARVKRVIFAASDPKVGALHAHPLLAEWQINHRLEVHSGILAEESSLLLKKFFQNKRQSL